MDLTDSFLQQVRRLHADLAVPDDYASSSGLQLCPVPTDLVSTELDYYGRPQQLRQAAFEAWSAMKQAAADAGVTIHLISAFRDLDYQHQLIRNKLERGESIDQILRVNAALGYSEHHSGCAIDIGTLGCDALVEEFELTPAFAWLQQNAAEHGFFLSYPRGNAAGIAYEPWHWCFRGSEIGI